MESVIIIGKVLPSVIYRSFPNSDCRRRRRRWRTQWLRESSTIHFVAERSRKYVPGIGFLSPTIHYVHNYIYFAWNVLRWWLRTTAASVAGGHRPTGERLSALLLPLMSPRLFWRLFVWERTLPRESSVWRGKRTDSPTLYFGFCIICAHLCAKNSPSEATTTTGCRRKGIGVFNSRRASCYFPSFIL